VDGAQGSTGGSPAAGWYADPEDASQLRYWDGAAWTEHRSPAPDSGGGTPTSGGAAGGSSAYGAAAGTPPAAGSAPGGAYQPGGGYQSGGAYQSGGGYQPGGGYPPAGAYGPPTGPGAGTPAHPAQGLAIAALVCAGVGVLFLAFCPPISPLLWIAGLITGIMGLSKARRTPPAPSNVTVMSWIGVGISGVGLLFIVIAILAFSAFLFAGF
jgi:hypothetical protein